MLRLTNNLYLDTDILNLCVCKLMSKQAWSSFACMSLGREICVQKNDIFQLHCTDKNVEVYYTICY